MSIVPLTTTTVLFNDVLPEQVNESIRRVELIQEVIKYNSDADGPLPTEWHLVDFIRTSKPTRITFVLQNEFGLKQCVNDIIERISIIDSFLKRGLTITPQYNLYVHSHTQTSEILKEEKKIECVTEAIKREVNSFAEKSDGFNFFGIFGKSSPQSKYTFKEVSNTNMVIHFVTEYQINDEARAVLSSKLSGAKYFLYSFTGETRISNGDFITVYPSPLTYLSNSLIPTPYTNYSFDKDDKFNEIEMNGYIISAESSASRVFASRISEYKLEKVSVCVEKQIGCGNKRKVWSCIINEKKYVLKQYHQAQYLFNETYMDYLDSNCLCCNLANSFNELVTGKDLKKVEIGQCMLFVVCEKDYDHSMRLDELKEFIDKKDKFIVEEYVSIDGLNENIFTAINENGSNLTPQHERMKDKKKLGIMTLNRFNHYCYGQGIENSRDNILLKNVKVVRKEKENKYVIISAEFIHSKVSKYFFSNFSSNFIDVSTNFFKNHRCDNCCGDWPRPKDTETDIIMGDMQTVIIQS
ncbi:Alpha-type protein kinase domain-containing protein [Entamoeba marina]